MPETLALFSFLLIKATHKPRKIGTPYGVVSLEAGQYISGRLELASALKMSERGVRTSLERLVKMEILTIKATSRYSIYTIVKYAEYQDCGQQATSKTPTDDQQATSKRPASDQQATTKQEHKHINTEELKPLGAKRACQLPDDFKPTDEHFELADKNGVNLHNELEKFADYHKAKGSTMKDWNAALRTWIRNAAAYAKKNTPSKSRADSLQLTGDLLTGRKPLNAAIKLD